MVLAVIVLGLVGAGSATYLTMRSGAVAQEVVDDYFTALEERRFDDAYRALCADTRSNHPRATFESTVGTRPPTAHAMTGELFVNALPWKTTGTVGVSITYADGTSGARKVPLVRQDGDWLICGPPV